MTKQQVVNTKGKSQFEMEVAKIRSVIDARLGALMPTPGICALLDFPNHSNAGDSAIWLGERKWLKDNGHTVVYVCDKDNYDEAALRRVIGDGIILLHGGGNFGDLWPEYQNFRETVIESFPENFIIQLPQTIHFKGHSNIQRTRRVLAKARNFSILCRDTSSFQIAEKELGVRSFLCPDMAFALGELKRSREPEFEILWLSRTDRERINKRGSIYTTDVRRTDWIDEIKDNEGGEAELESYKRAFYFDLHAEKQVERGCNILGQGKVVVTDRLHGHILSTLMKIPNLVLDNNYGKVKSFHSEWTSGFQYSLLMDENLKVNSVPDSAKVQFEYVLHSVNSKFRTLEQVISMLGEHIETDRNSTTLWYETVEKIKENLKNLVLNKRIVLIDDDLIFSEICNDFNIKRFTLSEEQYGGPVKESDEAIRLTENHVEKGVRFLVVAFPAFWWFDFYPEWTRYLYSTYRCLAKNDSVVVFDLDPVSSKSN